MVSRKPFQRRQEAHPLNSSEAVTARTLRVHSVEAIPLVVPLEREYRGSYYGMQNRATIVTRVTTDEGVVGEAYVGDEDATLGQITSIIKDEIVPTLLGQNMLAYEKVWELCYPVTFDQLRDKRVSLVALAAIDLAIWDALGKELDIPLWQLWGGYRNTIPVNIIGGYYAAEDGAVRDEVAEWRAMGFKGCKFKIGGKTPREDAARLEVAREAAGDEFVITIDANQGYSLWEALDLCERVRDLNIRWFEEPCIWSNDLRAMREVRSRGGIPICAGQSEFSPEGCRDLMEGGAIDVCNFDASWSGGYTNWKRMAATARLYDVQLAHHEEPQIATHLLSAHPGGTFVEVFHPDRDPIWWNIIANRPPLIDGAISPPTRPGLGWELDESFIEQYRVDR